MDNYDIKYGGEIIHGYCFKVQFCIDNDLDIPKFGIQSSNGPGADNIRAYLLNYHKFYKKSHSEAWESSRFCCIIIILVNVLWSV